MIDDSYQVKPWTQIDFTQNLGNKEIIAQEVQNPSEL